MSNQLKNQTSPYLLQHAENPVEWYPWGPEAFRRALDEDKPIFLSIGYSTCHWCHVMAHESFEDPEIARILNQSFISIKVDKEERPDIDSIYMAVCQTFTGSGGWPTSIFMTARQKPFFAGTYFPRTARYGMPGLKELLLTIREKWQKDREVLLRSAEEVTAALGKEVKCAENNGDSIELESLLHQALAHYRQTFDSAWGGFGDAPKFPASHNLLFLLQQYKKHKDHEALKMAETTLRAMYAGGLFDHIGYGFCRYSTDRYYLVPHFEKMLCDNALLILSYCEIYHITKNPFYLEAAEKTASYIAREMTSPEGGFYSAQDADSEGEEGKYYTFVPSEIIDLLGEQTGTAFNKCFDITPSGNFEGKSIPNLLHTGVWRRRSGAVSDTARQFDSFLPQIRAYRKRRSSLHLDDKILTYWNALMIAAFCALYRSSHRPEYRKTAQKAQRFLEERLCQNELLHVSFREGQVGAKGFLEDYAGYAFALLALYDVTFDKKYLARAQKITEKAIDLFYDHARGGFYLYGRENEELLFRPKETYDGALPSGNSLMVHNLFRLHFLSPDDKVTEILQKQVLFLSHAARNYPVGCAMFLTALSDYLKPPAVITIVLQEKLQSMAQVSMLPFQIPSGSLVKILEEETPEYKLLNGQTTYYVCRGHSCLAPTNDLISIDIS